PVMGPPSPRQCRTGRRRTRRRTTRAPTSTSSGWRRRSGVNAWGGTRPTCAAPACSATSSRSRLGPRRRTRCERGLRRRRLSRQQTSRFFSSTRTRRRRPRSRPSSASYGSCSVSELTLVEAINDAFHTELARHDSVLVMGEDVGRAGGVFRATAGLRDKFGAERCVDTPLAEAGILGAAVGLCMAGWRPVCEMQYDAFSYPCLDQLITHVGRYRSRTRGGLEC